MSCSRRHFLQTAGTGLVIANRLLPIQPLYALTPPVTASPTVGRSRVALVQGENRRKNITSALTAIDDQIQPRLKGKKYVIIKPNNVSTNNQLASTHVDALRGILDYLAPRFNGPVVIAESSAEQTLEGFESFHYAAVIPEYRPQQVRLVDLNQEARYQAIQLVDYDLHPVRVRLAARLLDPEAFVISAAILKTHDTVVATMAVKNMVLGSPLHSAPGEKPEWSDKEKYHSGIRQTHYNMLLTAQKLQPNWGVAVIDGFEGMEGQGPTQGTPVPSRIALASTDFVAADRVGLETMGIKADWIGYLQYCAQAGLGQYDLAKIDVQGAAIAEVRRSYKMHGDLKLQLDWMGPLTHLPPKLG
jgi:uncharacterized protein (DUF362 family)